MTAGRLSFTSNKEWGTPLKYVEAVRKMFGGNIVLDPCSNVYSLVDACIDYILPDQDGLKESWNYPSIYVNPPYGIDRLRGTRISDWLKRCLEAHQSYGSEVLALIPVATNTGHWKKYIWNHAVGIAFLYDTRLRFLVNGEDIGKGAPMSCAMVYWGKDFEHFRQIFSRFGAVIDLNPSALHEALPEPKYPFPESTGPD